MTADKITFAELPRNLPQHMAMVQHLLQSRRLVQHLQASLCLTCYRVFPSEPEEASMVVHQFQPTLVCLPDLIATKQQ